MRSTEPVAGEVHADVEEEVLGGRQQERPVGRRTGAAPEVVDREVAALARHGDVVVWGGPARLNFHGVAPLADGAHPLLGHSRINLTFRAVF